jgi:hypothetical protein
MQLNSAFSTGLAQFLQREREREIYDFLIYDLRFTITCGGKSQAQSKIVNLKSKIINLKSKFLLLLLLISFIPSNSTPQSIPKNINTKPEIYSDSIIIEYANAIDRHIKQIKKHVKISDKAAQKYQMWSKNNSKKANKAMATAIANHQTAKKYYAKIGDIQQLIKEKAENIQTETNRTQHKSKSKTIKPKTKIKRIIDYCIENHTPFYINSVGQRFDD